MNPKEILRLVDTLHREKRIEKEVIFTSLETALYTAARKKFGEEETEEGLEISIDRIKGNVRVVLNDEEIEPDVFGRIAAQTFKQVMMQKLRMAEGDVVFENYQSKQGALVMGTVQGFERGAVMVNLGDAEAILPRGEQAQGENYNTGARFRFYLHKVSREGQRVKVIVSRARPEMILELFKLEIPEIESGVIKVDNIVREAGLRTKICVSTNDPKVDCVGACVGMRGARIKNVLSEIGQEKIDIVTWTDEIVQFIENAMKPAEVEDILVDTQEKKAQVLVQEDLLSQAIGRKGVNVRLASQLTGYYIDVSAGESGPNAEDFFGGSNEEDSGEAADEGVSADDIFGDAAPAVEEVVESDEAPAADDAVVEEEASVDNGPSAEDIFG